VGNSKQASGISERNLSERVRTLGKRIGIPNLSAHDCRHNWATRAVKGKTDAFALRDAGGWASLAMPSRYVEAAAIANERVTLG
jgi:integrase